MTTISDLVSQALANASNEIKLASAPNSSAAPSFLDEALGLSTPKSAPAQPSQKTASAANAPASILDDAAFGMKLAEALERSASILDAPGPTVQESPFVGTAPKLPVSQTNSLTPGEKTDGGGTLGPQGKLENTMDDYAGMDTGEKSAAWDKTAALRLIDQKVAQAELLNSMGQKTAARLLLNDAEGLRNKMAADPSSPQANLPAHNDSFRLPTESAHTSMIGDNASLIAMTRSSANDKSIRESGAFISEQPKLDPTIANVVGSSEGAKISSLAHAVRSKVAAEPPGVLEAQALEARRLRAAAEVRNQASRESRGVNGTILGVGGGLVGGATGMSLGHIAGHAIGGGKGARIGEMAGGALGLAGGAYGGARMGIAAADAERAARIRDEADAAGKTAGATSRLLAAEKTVGHGGALKGLLAKGQQASAKGSAGAVGRGSYKLSAAAEAKLAGATSRLLAAEKTVAHGGGLKGMLAGGRQAAAKGSAGAVARPGYKMAGEKEAGATSRLLAAEKTMGAGGALKGLLAKGQQASAKGSAGRVQRVMGSVAGGV